MNKQSFKKQIMKGFTLVELLIVVIILAILAAIVVPQFSSSTVDAKESSLDTTLANMRSALDLYYQQHGGRYPGAYKETDGAATTVAAENLAAFKAQLTLYSDASGVTADTKTATIKYGPYFKRKDIPKNPITGSNAMVFQVTGALGLTTLSTGLGWKYDIKTGEFIADDANTDSGGTVKFSEH